MEDTIFRYAGAEQTGPPSLATTPSLSASDNAGGVTRQDLRAPTSAGQRWKVSESKAGCISLNPANENYFATAHLNRDVRIWDARKMRAITDWQDADYHQVYANASMADYEHGHACSSAYWDPSGRHLLTSSYDDRLRSECRKPDGTGFRPSLATATGIVQWSDA